MTMFLQKLYEQLPDEVRVLVSFEVVRSYILRGDPPFLPSTLSKIRKRNASAGHEIAVTFHALRVLAFEHTVKDEEQLQELWKKEMDKHEVQNLKPPQKIKWYLFRRKK